MDVKIIISFELSFMNKISHFSYYGLSLKRSLVYLIIPLIILLVNEQDDKHDEWMNELHFEEN